MSIVIQPSDRDLISELASRTSEALITQRMAALTSPSLNIDDHEFASRVIATEIFRMRAASVGGGGSLLTDEQLAELAMEQVFGLGRLQSLLNDETISDIHVRGSSPVWIKFRDGRREMVDPVVDSDQELIDLIRHIATRHTSLERRFDSANPELNLQLNDGSRIFATMEVSLRPSLIIRRHGFDISSLEELLAADFLPTSAAAFLSAVVRAKRNLIIAGGTGSGKTTLLRALLNEIPANERIVTIEDAYELGIDRFEESHPDFDALQTRPANTEGQGEITLSQLTRMALRMDPDRVVVGEVRGAEAFPMLMAMSQGNNGSMCTLHADSARSVFPKLAAYVSMASTCLPIETVNLLITSSIHFVIHIENKDHLRRITSIHEVVGAEGNTICSNEIFSYEDGIGLVPAYPIREDSLRELENAGFDARHLGFGLVG